MPCNLRILYGFSVMIQKQFFRVFQLFSQEVKYFYQKKHLKGSQVIFIQWNDLKYEIILAKNFLRKASKLRMSLEQFWSFIAT